MKYSSFIVIHIVLHTDNRTPKGDAGAEFVVVADATFSDGISSTSWTRNTDLSKYVVNNMKYVRKDKVIWCNE